MSSILQTDPILENGLNHTNFFDSPYASCNVSTHDPAPNDENSTHSHSENSGTSPLGSRYTSASDSTSLGSSNPPTAREPQSLGSHPRPTCEPSSLDRDTSSANGDFPETLSDENNNFEGNNDENNVRVDIEQPTVPRKSVRIPKLSKRLDGFVLESKVKYGLDRVVNYSHLKPEIKCFISSLHKSVETKTFLEAIKNQKWVNAMNLEFKALNLNGTWDIVDLPKGRTPIGSKWIFKIKYKENGEIDK